MIQYPQIDPVAIHLGPLKVHWYGLMYLASFLLGGLLLWVRAKRPDSAWTPEQVSDLILYAALGLLVGGRVGYMLIYALPHLIHHPLSLFRIWEGGMSFHGGLLGVLAALWLFSWTNHRSLWDATDFIVPVVPIGLALGRLGNFINGELWGRVTDVPWAMVFPAAGPLPRHPSQIYELLLEGVVLFILLWTVSAKPRPRFTVSALFLLSYGSVRFFCEYFRQPDPQLGFVLLDHFTMGQLLSFLMIIIGLFALCWIYLACRKPSSTG